MTKLGLSGLALAILALGCDPTTDPAAETLAPGVQLALEGQEISPRDQMVLDAFNNGMFSRAVINTEVSCAILPGFFDASGNLVAFGGLFPLECAGGTFERTNPDGTLDWHANGRGVFFLLTFEPSGFFSSTGSDVNWHIIQHENGIRILTVSGTLSNGSRVRVHFTAEPTGANNSSEGTLWIEGLGYVLRPGRGNR